MMLLMPHLLPLPLPARASTTPRLALLIVAAAGGLWLAGTVAAQSAGTPSAPPPAQPTPAPAQAAPDPDVDAEREVVVTLKSGQRITGLLANATEKIITIKVSGINASFPIADVERYEFLPPLMER